jgi:hypothetical protein
VLPVDAELLRHEAIGDVAPANVGLPVEGRDIDEIAGRRDHLDQRVVVLAPVVNEVYPFGRLAFVLIARTRVLRRQLVHQFRELATEDTLRCPQRHGNTPSNQELAEHPADHGAARPLLEAPLLRLPSFQLQHQGTGGREIGREAGIVACVVVDDVGDDGP